MSIDATTPVAAIEGTGRAITARFESIRVYVVFDLLRATSEQLHEAVKDVASLTQVQAWRQAAALLQVAEVTPQWAEALTKNSIFSLADLGLARLDELEALFLKAKQDAVIPDVPSLPQIAEMLKDAIMLNRSGAITGTVRDQAGQPVAGATAFAGAIHENTDARGRFRLLRIPLGSAVTLRIEHRDFKPFERSIARVSGVNQVAIEVIELAARSIRASPPAPRILSELAGDTLPPMTGQPVTSHALDASQIQEDDIFSLLSFYDNGLDAKLVSKLLSFEDGKFVARWVRIPKTSLPDSCKEGDHFRIRNGKFEPIRMDGRKLHAYTKLRSLRKRHANDPKPATPMEFENVFQSRLSELRNLGLLKKS